MFKYSVATDSERNLVVAPRSLPRNKAIHVLLRLLNKLEMCSFLRKMSSPAFSPSTNPIKITKCPDAAMAGRSLFPVINIHKVKVLIGRLVQ